MARRAVWSLMLLAIAAFWTLAIIGAFEMSFAVLDYISEWRMPVNLEAVE